MSPQQQQQQPTMDRRHFQRLALHAAMATPLVLGDSGRATATANTLRRSENSKLDTWYSWRGPNANNIASEGASIPDQLTAEHIRWQTPVRGRGHSSPVVTEDRVFLTTAQYDPQQQWVLGFDRGNGKQLWEQVIHRGGFPKENHPKNTEASSTLAFDGEHLFAVFFHAAALHLTSLTPEGQVRWQQNLGHYDPKLYRYGYASSPCIYEDTVIVVADYDGKPFLTARDCASGKEVWRVARPLTISFSSPIVGSTSGRDQLLLSGADRVMSYDPSNGEVLWETQGTSLATCGTMVWDEQRVFASGGFPKAETICIRSDGSGEKLWSNNQKCYEQSMLAFEGHVYAVTDAGVAYCWRASDGVTQWKERLGGAYSSSPVLVGRTIHVFNEQGEGFAFSADPAQYRALGKSKLADDVFPTPSVVGQTMYHRFAKQEANRRQEYLVAIS